MVFYFPKSWKLIFGRKNINSKKSHQVTSLAFSVFSVIVFLDIFKIKQKTNKIHRKTSKLWNL